MLWSDCAYAQAGLSICWSHIPHCWKSHVTAQLFSIAIISTFQHPSWPPQVNVFEKQVSMTRRCHNHRPQTNQCQHEEDKYTSNSISRNVSWSSPKLNPLYTNGFFLLVWYSNLGGPLYNWRGFIELRIEPVASHLQDEYANNDNIFFRFVTRWQAAHRYLLLEYRAIFQSQNSIPINQFTVQANDRIGGLMWISEISGLNVLENRSNWSHKKNASILLLSARQQSWTLKASTKSVCVCL